VAAVGALWREILGVGEVGPADDFFGLGGTSLRAGQLVTRLERLTGEIVYVRAVFDAPTLAGFCAYLAAEYPALAARLGRPDPPPAAPGRADRRVDAAMREEFRRIVTGPAPRARSARRLGPAAFILSAPRSGSTLLRVMLGGHPDLFAPPELELLGFETMAGRAAGLAGGTASLGDGLAHALTELERLTPDQAHDVLRAAGDEPVGLLYERIQHRLGGRLLVEKTSTYATDAAALRRAELLFDEPRYLHLVRHPAAMIRSYQQVRLDQVFRHRHPFTGRELAELTWQTATDNVARLLAGLPPHRHLTVRFEDLLADPERTLTRITGFLGVPFDPVLLEPYDGRRDRMSGGLHPESRMAGDPRFHQHTDLDRGVADAWRTTFDLGSLSTVTTTLARRYGYHEAPPTGGRTDPLSAHQRGIYLHQTVSGERSLYNICKAWRLRGPLDELALRTALQSLVDRHEALRTTITVTDGEPRQHVLAGCDVPVEVVVLPAGATDEAVRNRLEELAATRLDLESGPGLRILLIRIGDRDHVLGLLVHHALVDGSSLAIVLAELAPAYRAALAGAPLELPAPVGAADVRDTWDALTNRRAGADLAYWRETLDGLPPLLPLPTDRPRPSRKSYRGARVPIAFDGDGWQQARRLARGEGATLFIVLLAVFQGLLRRYTQPSDTDRIVVGTAFVNRQGFEDRDAVGMFTSTLPLCTAIPDDPTFRELLARVRDSCLDAFEHPGVPLEDLVRELNLERDPSYSPLVQVLFTSEPPQAQELRLPGLDVTRLDVDWRTSKFDLTVSLISGADALGGWWEYDADLFDADQVRRMTGHFLALLRQAAADPDRPLSGYDLLAPDERHQLVHGWNPAGAPAGAAPAEPVEALIRRWARERPDAVAVTGGGRQLGYGRLDAASDDIAVRLLGAGVGPNDIVAVLCERSPAFVAALLGVLKSGAGYLPIDPGTPAARVEYLLRDSGSRAVVVDPAWTGAAAEDLPRVTVDLDAVPEAAVVRKRDVEDGDLAYVIYTSGSTGQPKGVLVEHRSLRNFVGWFTAEHRLGPDDRCTQTVNVGFDACVMEVWPTLAAGAALHIAPTATLTDPPAMWRWQRDAGATVSFLVTPLLEAMLAEPLPAGLALRTVVTGGDQLHAQPALREAPFRLVNGYGPTENTILSTTAEVDPDDPRLPSIGRPVPGSTAYLLDGAMGPVPVGVEGELYVGGSQVARGYLDLPELSARRFVPDPFAGDPDARLFRTGDRARRRADGRIDFVGRADHQVKIRGYRIELGEIEAALRQLPGIREAVVVATGSGNDRRLDAFVLGDAPPAPDALRDALRRRLPGYMVPTTVTALDALPLTSNGKVDRRALAGRVGAAPRAAAAATPANPLEAELLDLWRRVLGDDRIGVTDSFFDVGGHSLNAMRLTSLIRDRTGRQVTLSALFTAPTVRDLARTLAGDHEGAAPAGHLVELGGAGGSAPLCCVHASDGSVLPYAPFAGICGADRPVWGLRAEPVPDAGHGSVEDMAASYVEELRRRHPAGPVHLLGWSFGGLLAYEMARQLTAAGEAPGRLILLDSEPLTGPDGPEHDPELLAEFSRQLRRRSGAPTAGAVPGDWAGLVRAARAAGWVDAEVDDRELRRAYDTFRGHVALGRRYVPPALAHPLTVFVATDRDPALRAAQVAAWQRLGTAGVTVTELAGDHFDAVSEQALRLVARALPAPRQPSGRQTNGKDLTGW
jgi:amino acid adenylation domain-containing protein